MPDEEEVSEHVDIAQALQLGRAIVNLQTTAPSGSCSLSVVIAVCETGRELASLVSEAVWPIMHPSVKMKQQSHQGKAKHQCKPWYHCSADL